MRVIEVRTVRPMVVLNACGCTKLRGYANGWWNGSHRDQENCA